MTIIDDLVRAIEAYPHESITLEIVDVDPPGDAINTGEDVSVPHRRPRMPVRWTSTT